MSKRDGDRPGPAAPFNDAFRKLAGRLGEAVPPVTAGPPATPPPPAGAGGGPASRTPARAVVRLERKGRGGKEATIVEKLALPRPELEEWLKHLKRSLGCGGAVEGEALALQGDLRERVQRLLQERGVRKVTLG